MAEVVTPPSWMKWWNSVRSAVIAVVGSGGLGALMETMPLSVDVAAATGIAALWATLAWTLWQERLLGHLPMVLGDTVVRQMVYGRPAVRVRAWLGHGRPFQLDQVGVEWQPPGGAPPRALELDLPATDWVFGPLTLTAFLPELPVGIIRVRVVGLDGNLPWEMTREYALTDLVQGPLASPVTRQKKGLRWNRPAWDQVQGR